MKLTAKTRHAHPVARKIPDNLWYNCNCDILDEHHFEKPNKQLLEVTKNDFPYNGHIALLLMFIHYPEPWNSNAINHIINTLKITTHEAFKISATMSRIEILQWLQLQAPDKFLAMVQANNYQAFCWAAQNGRLEILKWLKLQAPTEFLAMVQAESHQAFRWAAENDHLEILEWLQLQAPDKFLAMVQAESHQAFRWAAENGRLEILKWLQLQAPTEFLAMVQADNHYAFRYAVANGRLEILKWLHLQAPTELLAMVRVKNYQAFRWAAENGRLEIFKWLQLQAPTELLAMVRVKNYQAFRCAAENGRLEILKWLQLQAPTELLAMVQADNHYAFRWAAANGHLETIKYLLLNPSCLAYAEMHQFEYGKYVNPFISNQISSLKQRSLAVEADNPNAVFNLTSPDEIQSCFYILRNLIRRNDRTLDDELLFLLSIPAVKELALYALTPNQPNEAGVYDDLLSKPVATRLLFGNTNFFSTSVNNNKRINLEQQSDDKEDKVNEPI